MDQVIQLVTAALVVLSVVLHMIHGSRAKSMADDVDAIRSALPNVPPKVVK
jgi:hypothetical protein